MISANLVNLIRLEFLEALGWNKCLCSLLSSVSAKNFSCETYIGANKIKLEDPLSSNFTIKIVFLPSSRIVWDALEESLKTVLRLL